MSELLFVPEAKIAGPLPPDVQHYTAFSAGVAVQAKNSTDDKSRLTFLSAEFAQAAYSIEPT